MVDGFSHLPKPLQDVALGMIAFTVVGGPLFMFGGAILKIVGMLLTGVSTVVGAEGMAALQAGIAMTATEMAALAAPVAAAVAVFEMFNAKHGVFHTAGTAVANAGYKTGEWLVHGLSHLGLFTGADRANRIGDYLHSKEFKSYGPLIDTDIMGLMNPKSYQANHLGKVYSDLANYGKNVNLNDIPGISDAVRNAVRDGMKEAEVSVVLPNGRILAQTVNEVNRKAQNRK
jgi:hypothetical protein